MNLDEISYDCLSVLSGTSLITDDNQLSLELVRFKVVNTRAFLIRQEQNKGYSISENISQTLPCVSFIQVDESLCPCTVNSECIILRTELPLPKFIETRQKDLVMKVSGPGLKSISYSVTPYSRVPWSGLNKETANNPKAFLHENYIYLLNSPALITIGSIRGVFEDPRDAAQFSTCAGEPCWSNKSEFPISAHMVNTLKQLVIKDLTQLMGTQQDTRGDERFNKPNDSK